MRPVTTALVIENDPAEHLGRVGDWLAEAGMEFDVLRPHAGEEVPGTPGGHDAVVALGGGLGEEWTGDLVGLLECAVADATPTLALGSSAMLLAEAFGGASEPSEDANGPRMLAKRDAAGHDQLFGPAPMTLDVFRWRSRELVSLPEEATLLAGSPYGSLDVFRVREAAWGVQSRFELTPGQLAEFGVFDETALAKAADIDVHIVETWRPIVRRFARIATGERRALPVVDA